MAVVRLYTESQVSLRNALAYSILFRAPIGTLVPDLKAELVATILRHAELMRAGLQSGSSVINVLLQVQFLETATDRIRMDADFR